MRGDPFSRGYALADSDSSEDTFTSRGSRKRRRRTTEEDDGFAARDYRHPDRQHGPPPKKQKPNTFHATLSARYGTIPAYVESVDDEGEEEGHAVGLSSGVRTGNGEGMCKADEPDSDSYSEVEEEEEEENFEEEEVQSPTPNREPMPLYNIPTAIRPPTSILPDYLIPASTNTLARRKGETATKDSRRKEIILQRRARVDRPTRATKASHIPTRKPRRETSTAPPYTTRPTTPPRRTPQTASPGDSVISAMLKRPVLKPSKSSALFEPFTSDALQQPASQFGATASTPPATPARWPRPSFGGSRVGNKEAAAPLPPSSKAQNPLRCPICHYNDTYNAICCNLCGTSWPPTSEAHGSVPYPQEPDRLFHTQPAIKTPLVTYEPNAQNLKPAKTREEEPLCTGAAVSPMPRDQEPLKERERLSTERERARMERLKTMLQQEADRQFIQLVPEARLEAMSEKRSFPYVGATKWRCLSDAEQARERWAIWTIEENERRTINNQNQTSHGHSQQQEPPQAFDEALATRFQHASQEKALAMLAAQRAHVLAFGLRWPDDMAGWPGGVSADFRDYVMDATRYLEQQEWLEGSERSDSEFSEEVTEVAS
ncbi:hypothetical protein BDW02DRAFT_42195 [Decorospora gaudefroyi]|uniref:Uncharacterized protein n=1 Tax=Decorospora gaudefroyi TaxID=184978 RepID=A0A6A5KA67_9PLEO|nr:hypothetical protein BDW02DRAFT_42195 [Decorospora gaudefroyi]